MRIYYTLQNFVNLKPVDHVLSMYDARKENSEDAVKISCTKQ